MAQFRKNSVFVPAQLSNSELIRMKKEADIVCESVEEDGVYYEFQRRRRITG